MGLVVVGGALGSVRRAASSPPAIKRLQHPITLRSLIVFGVSIFGPAAPGFCIGDFTLMFTPTFGDASCSAPRWRVGGVGLS